MQSALINTRRAIFALLALVVAVQITRQVAAGAIDDWADYVVGFTCASLCLWRAASVPKERVAWLLIGLNLLAWALGDVAWTIANDQGLSYPNFSDAIYMISYPLAFVGIWLLLRSRRPHTHGWDWLDALVGGLALTSLAAALLFGPLIEQTSANSLEAAVTAAYPVLDMATLCLVVVAIGSSGWRIDRTWAMLGAGLALTALADGIYSYGELQNDVSLSNLAEPFWPIAMILTAASAWQPRRISSPHPEMVSTLVPVASSVLALAILVLSALGEGSFPMTAVIAAAAALVVAGLRSTLTFRENVLLLRDSRAEALTDTLTGLGNRRALMSELNERLESGTAPAVGTIVFFDLDGFKGYNDAFGHNAGDALLVRLSRRLRSAVGHHGAAFRPGGDEFCVLYDGALGRDHPLVTRAASALSDAGDGFEIGASFGIVVIPEEADTPTLAMHLVDERMYNDKGDRRASTRRQARDLLMQLLREREPDLEQHVGEVADLATLTGRRLGLDRETVDEIARAAELHDLGKVAIPDSILHKAGPLDDSEWELMHQHTIVGERILAAVPILRPVAKLVRASHERWDGGGYPDGLVGDQIPLGARVISVCDAYDAMVTVRPYSNALSVEEALREIKRCAGTQFDPAVVAEFVQVVLELETASKAPSLVRSA